MTSPAQPGIGDAYKLHHVMGHDHGLPKEIDTFLFGDQTKEPFTSRFKFKKR